MKTEEKNLFEQWQEIAQGLADRDGDLRFLGEAFLSLLATIKAHSDRRKELEVENADLKTRLEFLEVRHVGDCAAMISLSEQNEDLRRIVRELQDEEE